MEEEEIEFRTGNLLVEETRGVIRFFPNRGVPSDDVDCRQLCILSLPFYMTVSEIFLFAPQLREETNYIRLIQDSKRDHCMLLLFFNLHERARSFYDIYNGRVFSSLGTEICEIAFVTEIQFNTPDSASDAYSSRKNEEEIPEEEQTTCPVCLERLRDVNSSGIFTLLCNHSFHSNCLRRCDSTCPVCRFAPPHGEDSVCAICGSRDALWMCMICGFIGCGRYEGGHAFNHFADTQHAYAMELSTHAVWDYVSDGFVHRIISNFAGGKMVEVQSSKIIDDGARQAHFDAKLEAMSTEYDFLLAHQLETQRKYFESCLEEEKFERRRSEQLLISDLENSRNEIELLRKNVAKLEKEKHGLEKKCNLMTTSEEKMEERIQFLEELNNTLTQSVGKWKDKAEEEKMDKESQLKSQMDRIQTLEEQTRDLMFFIDAKKRIEEEESETLKDEIRSGTVVTEKKDDSSSSDPRKRLRDKLRSRRTERKQK